MNQSSRLIMGSRFLNLLRRRQGRADGMCCQLKEQIVSPECSGSVKHHSLTGSVVRPSTGQLDRCPLGKNLTSITASAGKTSSVTLLTTTSHTLRKPFLCPGRCCSTSSGEQGETTVTPTRTTTDFSEEELESIVDAIVQQASKRDKMVTTISRTKIREAVRGMLLIGFSKKQVAAMLRDKPSFLGKSVHPVLGMLMDFGFNHNTVLAILKTCPTAVTWNRDGFRTKLLSYQELGLSYDTTLKLITSSPQVLNLPVGSCATRISELKLLFKTTDALNLVTRFPELLFQDMESIQAKFDYVFHEMGVSQRQMMYSRLFRYPLSHVHARHVFLVRAGYFRRIRRKDGDINTNPTLSDIIDTTDRAFARKFGDMTEQDYKTFCKLLQKENLLAADENVSV